MTGTGRRRKPGPDEGEQPAAPAPGEPENDYAYDWRRAPAAPTPQPGPVFEAYRPQPDPAPGSGPGYNPVGYGLADPYAPAAYSAAPAAAFPAPPAYPPPPRPEPGVPAAFPRQGDGRGQGAVPPLGARAPETDLGSLFDDDDPFGDAAGTVPAPAESGPVRPAPADGEPRPRDGYTAADFAFLEAETDERDVSGWLTFAESRAESRADRTRRFRVRLIGALVVLALAAAGLGGYLWANGGTFGTPAPTKSVIMLQVSDSTGNAVADALLVADRTAAGGPAKNAAGKGAAVLIPSVMMVNTTGFGPQPFGGRMSQSIPAAGKDTVADILGITIDGVWRMDEITFAELIDQIGGITLDADTAVPAATASPTAPPVGAGHQKLSGPQAVAYATYTRNGDTAAAQPDRFGQVVQAVLAALPADSASITAYLNQLGTVDDPSLPDSKLSPILTSLATEEQAGAFTVQPLPLRTDGSDELDYQAAAPVVSTLLGGAVKAGSAAGQISRVLVDDGSGHTGSQSAAIRDAAQAKLANGGYTFIDGETVGRRATSVVEVPDANQKDTAVQIAETLGLPAIDVQIVPNMPTVADVTVILGADWLKLAGVTLPTGSATATAAAGATPSATGKQR